MTARRLRGSEFGAAIDRVASMAFPAVSFMQLYFLSFFCNDKDAKTFFCFILEFQF